MKIFEALSKGCPWRFGENCIVMEMGNIADMVSIINVECSVEVCAPLYWLNVEHDNPRYRHKDGSLNFEAEV